MPAKPKAPAVNYTGNHTADEFTCRVDSDRYPVYIGLRRRANGVDAHGPVIGPVHVEFYGRELMLFSPQLDAVVQLPSAGSFIVFDANYYTGAVIIPPSIVDELRLREQRQFLTFAQVQVILAG